jgi:hypothetical protein
MIHQFKLQSFLQQNQQLPNFINQRCWEFLLYTEYKNIKYKIYSYYCAFSVEFIKNLFLQISIEVAE